jgi:hypothetical protein
MNKSIAVFSVVLSASLVGCVSTTSLGKAVSIVDEEELSANCADLGEVTASPPFVGPSDAKNKLRNDAGELGANTIVLTKYGIGTAKAQAYKCDDI